MGKFFKACGKGLLCVIACPFIIVLVCGYAAVGFAIFFFLIFKSIILFFKGRTIFSDLPEDIEAKKIIRDQMEKNENSINPIQETQNNENGPLSLYPSDSNMYKSEFSALHNDNVQEEEPEPVNIKEVPSQETPSFNNVVEERKEPDREEIIGTFKPLSSNNKDEK